MNDELIVLPDVEEPGYDHTLMTFIKRKAATERITINLYNYRAVELYDLGAGDFAMSLAFGGYYESDEKWKYIFFNVEEVLGELE